MQPPALTLRWLRTVRGELLSSASWLHLQIVGPQHQGRTGDRKSADAPGEAWEGTASPRGAASVPLALQLWLKAEGRAGCDAWLPRKDPPLHPEMHLSIKKKMLSVPYRTGLGFGE